MCGHWVCPPPVSWVLRNGSPLVSTGKCWVGCQCPRHSPWETQSPEPTGRVGAAHVAGLLLGALIAEWRLGWSRAMESRTDWPALTGTGDSLRVI